MSRKEGKEKERGERRGRERQAGEKKKERSRERRESLQGAFGLTLEKPIPASLRGKGRWVIKTDGVIPGNAHRQDLGTFWNKDLGNLQV